MPPDDIEVNVQALWFVFFFDWHPATLASRGRLRSVHWGLALSAMVGIGVRDE
jgi:hypothetical protein